MFERFTDEARRVLVLAQEEARTLDHNHIGTEHILLGVIHEGEGAAATALESLGVSLDVARAQVAGIVGGGVGTGASAGDHVPFTPRAKKVLELSLREALQLGSDHIGSTHLLLGLLREGEGVAAQVLDRLGVAPEQIRRELGEVMAPRQPTAADRPPRRWLGRRPRSADVAADESTESQDLLEPWPIEHFDDSAWEALAAARRAARDRGAREIGPHDLLVGVAAVAGPGADALAAAGATVDALTAGSRSDGDPVEALPFDPTARAALVWAGDEARRRSHPATGTAHMLLGLLVAADTVIVTALEAANVDRGDLHAEVGRRLA